MPVAELAIVPAAKRGLFIAMHGELALTAPTYQPVYAGARELLEIGFKPTTTVQVRLAGCVRLQAVLGELAKWTLALSTDGRPRKVLWQPTAAAA